MNCIKAFLTLGAAAVAVNAAADRVASFNMDVRDGQIVEAVSGQRFGVSGHFTPENVPGAVGKALRFDGYTSFVDARLGNILPSGTKKLLPRVRRQVFLPLLCRRVARGHQRRLSPARLHME